MSSEVVFLMVALKIVIFTVIEVVVSGSNIGSGWLSQVHISNFNICLIYFSLTDIDECVSHQCDNGGSCVDGVNNYSCNCLAGFTGSLCETGK